MYNTSRKYTYQGCFQYISSGVKRPQSTLITAGHDFQRERNVETDQANGLWLDDRDLGQEGPRVDRGNACAQRTANITQLKRAFIGNIAQQKEHEHIP